MSTQATQAQVELHEHMAYLSEEYWCAGWLEGLDEQLQDILTRGNRWPNGSAALATDDFEKLQRLHEAAGGWWVWDDAVGYGGPQGDSVRFVPQPPAEPNPRQK